jgi:hypothetical protein
VAHTYGMAQLMPTYGKELERVDNEPNAGNGPEPKKYDDIYDYLFVRLECI